MRIAALFLALLLAGPVAAQMRPTQDAQATATFADDLVAAMNAARAARGLRAYEADPLLALAAAGHAQDMARQGYLDHRSRDGRTMGDRIRAQGFRYCMAAENIAFGQPDVQEVVTTWMRSPGHRANVLLPDVRFAGAARAEAQGRTYWVAVFASPC
ncbi:CAP domain-containing protein [Pseudooceanicola sp. LIPI14-2-Ac024]|uniref:CAP domain-containing protein n=1 Tax=Pseudooceanicola sp. LIPI14-2-Ac024 TaxID=3344875 RepID=UPI0035CF459D